MSGPTKDQFRSNYTSMSTEELVGIRDRGSDLLQEAREALLEELALRGAADKRASDFVTAPNAIDERRHRRFEKLGEEIRDDYLFWVDWRFWVALAGLGLAVIAWNALASFFR